MTTSSPVFVRSLLKKATDGICLGLRWERRRSPSRSFRFRRGSKGDLQGGRLDRSHRQSRGPRLMVSPSGQYRLHAGGRRGDVGKIASHPSRTCGGHTMLNPSTDRGRGCHQPAGASWRLTTTTGPHHHRDRVRGSDGSVDPISRLGAQTLLTLGATPTYQGLSAA